MAIGLVAMFAALIVNAGVIFNTLPRDDAATINADCGQTWMTGTLGAENKLDTIEVATRPSSASGGSVYLAVYANNAASGNASSWSKGALVAVSSNTQDMGVNGVVNTFTFNYEALSDNTRYLYTFVNAATNGVNVGVGVRLNAGTAEARTYSTGVLAFNGGNHVIASQITTIDASGVPPSISSFSASPTAVFSNQTVTLSWTTANADELTLLPDVGDVTGISSTNVTITGDVMYTLIASNAFKSVTNTVAVTMRGLELGKAFDDHMVLQRNDTVPVYGFDTPGQSITVTFAGQTKVTTADGNGNWRVDLDPMEASMTGRTLTVTGSSTVSITDVLVGEVWLAAGQSNMDWQFQQQSDGYHAENFGRIRMCNWQGSVDTASTWVYGPEEFARLTPEKFYEGTWEVLDATTIQTKSATAYFFANALARELAGTGPGGSDVPVGILELSYQGTVTEAFIAPADLRADPYLKASFENPGRVRTIGSAIVTRIAQELSAYTHTDPALPHPHPFAPGFLYHVGIAQLTNFTFKGAIWYQGESNTYFADAPFRWNGDRLSDYQTHVMTTLVDSWRNAFGKPDFPIYMVQLPRINIADFVLWPWYREAQSRVAKNIEGVELAVLPEWGGALHPTHKHPVGERLAYIARNKLYGENIACSGPVYTSQEIVGNKIVLHFDHVEDGLISKDGQPLRNFEISGEDRTFVPATATIVGDTVEVTAAAVANPVAVRYAWAMDIDVNFFNSNSNENLPASPFRTDDWMVAPGRKIRVACIGDSVTYGSGIADPSVDGYPAQLQNILGTTNFEVKNFGKPGAGVVRPSNKYDASAEHAAALAYNPDIVICNLGINEFNTDVWGTFTTADFVREYRDLVDAYASLSTRPLFIQWHQLSPLFPGQAQYGSGRDVAINQMIAESYPVTGALTVDMHDFFLPHPEWYPDHLHPNAEGARNIAEQTFRFLATLDPLYGKPAITEFMANNTATLQDDDGDYSDWIELKNEGITGMVLGGYHLSETAANPQRWQVPAGVPK